MDGCKEGRWTDGKWMKEGRWGWMGLLLLNSHSHLVDTDRHHLLGFALLHFKDTAFFTKGRFADPALMKSISTIFTTAFSHLMSLCHTLVVLIIVHKFSMILYFYDDP